MSFWENSDDSSNAWTVEMQQYNLKPKTQTDLILRQVRSLVVFFLTSQHKGPGVSTPVWNLEGQCLHFAHGRPFFFFQFSPEKSSTLPTNKKTKIWPLNRDVVMWHLMPAGTAKKCKSNFVAANSPPCSCVHGACLEMCGGICLE